MDDEKPLDPLTQTPMPDQFWMLPVFFVLKKKEAMNAFELFHNHITNYLIQAAQENKDVSFFFELGDMELHDHSATHCKSSPISKEDVELIMKLTLPPDVLKRMDEERRKMTEKEPCERCEGKGKIKEGNPPIVEVRTCETCGGTGKKKYTQGGK